MHTRKNINIWLLTVIRKVLCFAMLLALTGCGPIYGIFIDPLVPKPKVPAERDISDKTVLVWVDDIACEMPRAILRRELTRHIQQVLNDHNAVGSVIPYENIVQFRQRNPNISELTVQQLGQKMQADEVLYVMIDNFKLYHEAGEGFYDTNMTGYCKIINSADGKRLWPAEQISRQFHAKGQFSQGEKPDMENKLIRQLCLEAAEEISLSFYKHQVSR